jgi:hypothetical protein
MHNFELEFCIVILCMLSMLLIGIYIFMLRFDTLLLFRLELSAYLSYGISWFTSRYIFNYAMTCLSFIIFKVVDCLAYINLIKFFSNFLAIFKLQAILVFIILIVLSTLLVVRGGSPRYRLEQISTFTFNVLLYVTAILLIVVVLALLLL